MSGGQLTNAHDALAYILGGRAVVTLVSEKTGKRYTYRINKGGDDSPHFVSVLTGPNNTEDYSYLGTIFAAVRYTHGKKSGLRPDIEGAMAFPYAFNHLVAGRMPPHCEVWHEGACGKCGRALTDPESIATGLGPVCGGRR